ncbi:MAG: DUF418 domain-containing protein [Burkholderiales bacterium]|nr:DUF418 domain-containing protein [Burkholderiales bacterium]
MNQNSRLLAIDLARGIAMLGVALVNVHAFALSWSVHYALDLAAQPWDVAAEYVVATLFTHRSYPVLAFLFGAGVAMQWGRLPEPTRQPRDLRPRFWALLVLGIAHGLILWPGDVLSTYAIVGLVSVGLLKSRTHRIGAVSFVVFVVAAMLYVVLGLSQIFSAEAPRPWPWPEATSFAIESWRETLTAHPGEYAERGLAQILVIDMWAFFALGMWAHLTGLLQRFVANPFAKPMLAAAGAVLLFAGTGAEYYAATQGGWDAKTYTELGSGWMSVALLPASLGGLWFWLTIGSFWSVRGGSTRGVKSLVIATGRAPLTQFFGQSIVFAILFNKSLIGWHGELGRFAYSMIAVVTYILLSGFIRAWLASGHAHGPMETLWRGLTRRFSPPRLDKSPVESTPS